jgi:hypothetical protein
MTSNQFKQAALGGMIAALLSGGAYAQNTANDVQRNVNQQQRIESGLKDGSLNTREAARLEKGAARIERMEANATRDGKISPQEQRRITAAQNRESQAIYNERHDAQKGNPNSASSQRMQADVQRNVNQQQRIENGVKSGQLTNREAGRLERGEAKVSRMEARAGADGHVGKAEQGRIQRAENRESRAIHRQKHDAQVR